MAHGVTVGKCMRMMFFFFFRFDPAFFLLFSLSLPTLFFCLFLRISYAGPFEPRLIGVDGAAVRRYNGKPNIFGSKIGPFFFFLLRKPFAPFLPFLYMLESSCSYYYYHCNWKIACINLAVRAVQKCKTAITLPPSKGYVLCFSRCVILEPPSPTYIC